MATSVFIHVGDIHLQATSPRNPDRLRALDQIVREGLAHPHLAAWLIPGDLFHAKSTIDDRNALASRLLAMLQRAPVVLTRGNHDSVGDLDIFAKLKAPWPCYVQTTPGVLQVPLPTGETAAIAILPYPEKGTLVGAGIAPGDVVQTASQFLDVLFIQMAHELGLARVSGCIPLFMGHLNINGAIASTGQPQWGIEIELDRAMLQRLPAVYCALNHIHRPQEVGAGVFAGSIAAMDHGEVEAKSYVVVTAARGPDGWTPAWQRQPIDTPPMFHVDGRLSTYGFTVDSRDETHDAEIHRRIEARDWAGCDLRVRYSYLASEKSVLSEATIRELFTGALRLKIEGVVIPDRDLRSPAVAQKKTLPDKLAAFFNVEQLAPSVAAKLALLEQHDQDQVLGDVARALAAIERPQEVMAAA